MGDDGSTPRMSGYLEKKGKMRMMSTWKRYWFVLEGRLLLYYRSKDEYDAISPCKGSINLGPPCSVKSYPSMACVFQLETRNNTITLRAENSDDQKNWMQAIMTALNQNQSVKFDTKKQLNYFRYSLSYLVPKTEPNQVSSRQFLERQKTLPPNKDNDEIIERLRKIGAHSYGGSLNAITKFTKSPSQCSLKCDDLKKRSNSSNNVAKNEQHIYESISSSTNRLDNLIIDNDNYSLPLKNRSSLYNSNDNLIVDNTQYCGIIDGDNNDNIDKKSETNEYVYEEVPVDCNKNSVIIDNNFYCKSGVDTENEYEDLDKYRNNDDNDKKSAKKKKKKACRKLGIFHNNNNNSDNNNNDNNKEKGLKKSQSFLQKVWKKRNRKQTKTTTDNNDNEDDLYVEVDRTIVEKTDLNDSSTVQILSELQQILENKKPLLKKTLSSETSCDNKSHEVRLPILPPKENKIKNISETVRNIDEILKDLNCEPKESKTKVKLLIDKFNSDNITGTVDDIDDETVELRQQSRNSTKRYSNDLNLLLDELAKVTVAPIMTPGVTISLINPNISDDELLKLLPIRKRRLSEPDYDIPRSHRSIQSLSKRDDDDGLTATRFFGPVLDNSNKDERVYSSMTPDSLEIDDSDPKVQFDGSYTSHTYNNNSNNDKMIYSSPKTLISLVNTSRDNQQNKENMIVYQHIDDEIFDDSLEDCNETFTKF